MNIEHIASQLANNLKDRQLERLSILYMLRNDLKECEERCTEPQNADYLLELAKESGRKLFKLIGRVNDSGHFQLMEWADEGYNFVSMVMTNEDIENYKNGMYKKRTYTLEELPEVIDRALSWHNSSKKRFRFSSTELQLQAVD